MLRIYNTEIEKTWWPPPLSSTLLCARVTSAAMPYEAFTLVGFPKVNWSWRCKARSPPPQKTAMKNTARSSWPGLSPLYTWGSAPMDPSPTGQAIGVWCRVNQGGVSLGKPIPSSLNWFLGCWKLRYFSHIQVGGSPRADAGNAGEILSLRWFGNTSEEVDKEKIWESLLRWLLPEPRPGWVSGKKTWMENIWNGNKKINRVNNATVCHYF